MSEESIVKGLRGASTSLDYWNEHLLVLGSNVDTVLAMMRKGSNSGGEESRRMDESASLLARLSLAALDIVQMPSEIDWVRVATTNRWWPVRVKAVECLTTREDLSKVIRHGESAGEISIAIVKHCAKLGFNDTLHAIATGRVIEHDLTQEHAAMLISEALLASVFVDERTPARIQNKIMCDREGEITDTIYAYFALTTHYKAGPRISALVRIKDEELLRDTIIQLMDREFFVAFRDCGCDFGLVGKLVEVQRKVRGFEF